MIAVTKEQREQFREEGYFVLEGAIEAPMVQMLREELDVFIEKVDAEMDAEGVTLRGLDEKGKRYFIAKRFDESERIPSFVYSDLMAEICRNTLGPDAWLFWEQFVVKMAEVGTKFSWHQDSGYLKRHFPDYAKPYLTCWCALDDMTEENGTIYVLPYSVAGTREVVDHEQDDESNDLVGYMGDEPGIPVIVPAGSIAVFSTTLFHRSGPNTTDKPRRSYVVQYSADPILTADGTPWGWAEPFLQAGERVR